MNSFRQVCPSCNASLELPLEANGRDAVCPACQVQFVAAVPEVTVPDVPDAAPSTAVAPTPITPVAPVKSYRQISIESIWIDTQSVLSDRRRPLLLPFLLPSVLILLGLVLPLAYLSDLAITNRTRALVWTGICSPWFLLVVTYSTWFALNLAQDVCDAGPDAEGGESEEVRSWFKPKRAVFIALLIDLTIAITFAAVLIGLAGALIQVGNTIQALEIRLLTLVGAFVGAILLLTLAGMRLWPTIPLAMDGRCGVSVVRESLALTSLNQMTSFFLVVAVFLMVGTGFSLFGLGLPIAIPIAALTLVVAFRLIAGRRIPAFDRDIL